MTDQQPRAVLDVGSNTIRLLVARVRQGQLEPLLDLSEFVRLGLGVDKTGELQPDREDAAMEAITMLSNQARSLGAAGIVAIATSAVRDAANGDAFARRVRETTGIELDIISGEREAYLTYLGATMGLETDAGVIVCDLGGGSAELIYADRTGVRWATSQPLGSGRLTERFVHHDPPTPEELEAVAHYVRDVLGELQPAQPRLAIFTGGTATHVSWLAGRSGAIERLELAAVRQVVDTLSSHAASEIVSRYGVGEERAKVLPAGVAALQAIAEYYRVEQVAITRHGIREGAILDSLKRAGT